MTLENEMKSITDAPGYDLMFEACAKLVETSGQPKLASAALLNAACAVALGTMGREVLEDTMRGVMKALPVAEARASMKLV